MRSERLKSTWANALAALFVVAMTSACNGEPAPEESAPARPPVDAGQAGEAVSDAMLVASQALYLAISGPTRARRAESSDGRLVLVWSEDADFLTGAGTYEITVDEYTIGPDDPFAEYSAGYALSGTILMSSQTGASTLLVFDLELSHEDADAFPARSLELRLSGFQDGTDREPDGSIRVNGREFDFDDLVASF